MEVENVNSKNWKSLIKPSKLDVQISDDLTHAKIIAEHFKVHPDLHDDFADWYYDFICQNPDLFQSFSINLDSDYIVDWWEDLSYLYDDFDSPYMEIKK